MEEQTRSRSTDAGFSWRRLQLFAGLLIVAMAVYFFITDPSPFILIFLLPVGIGVLLSSLLKGRIGVVWLGIVSLLLLIMNGASVPTSLSVPASVADFIPTLVLTGCLLTMVVAAVPAFRAHRDGETSSQGARLWGIGLVLVLIAGSIYSLVASSRYASPVAADDDIQVVTEDFEFEPSTITAEGGEMTLFIDNRDSATHTFTIEELDIDVVVPGKKSARATVNVPAGKTYTFVCRPHAPDMKGTLKT